MLSSFISTKKKRQVARFMEPMGTFTYYEDIYGTRNRHELGEDAIDCYKSDSDQKSTRKSSNKAPSSQVFQQLTSRRGRAQSFGVIKRTDRKADPTPSRDITRDTLAKLSLSSARLLDSRLASTTQIANKYGELRSQPSAMEVPNSAGKELNAMLESGGLSADGLDVDTFGLDSVGTGRPGQKDSYFGDVDEAQPELPSSERDVELRAPKMGVENDDFQADVDTGDQSASDGDVEDNASEPEKDVKNRRPRVGDARDGAAANEKERAGSTNDLGRKGGRAAAPSSASATRPRRSTRLSKAERPQRSKRISATALDRRAKQIAAANRAKMTARAVTLRKKARKKTVMEKKVQETAGTTSLRGSDGPRVSGKAMKAAKKGGLANGDLMEYYRVVYGRKSRARAHEKDEHHPSEPEHAEDVPAAVAKVMKGMAGLVEVDTAEVEDRDVYAKIR